MIETLNTHEIANTDASTEDGSELEINDLPADASAEDGSEPTCEDSSDSPTISAHEAAALLGVHLTTLYAGIRDGQIPGRHVGGRERNGRRVGGRYIIHRATLMHWLTQDTTRPDSNRDR